MVSSILPNELDHPKRLNSEQGKRKTLEFPFWAKGVVAKRGSWWFVSKNMVKNQSYRAFRGLSDCIDSSVKEPLVVAQNAKQIPTAGDK